MNNTILILAAHPDDEVLGCGGTVAKYADDGAIIHVAFLSDGVLSREGINQEKLDEIEKRRIAAKRSCDILGVRSISFGDMPDNRMDSVDLLDVVKVIENLIDQHNPKIVFTHHAGDLNIDHAIAHKAVVTACRPQAGHSVKTLLSFEIPSSTEWQLPYSSSIFAPNWFVDISNHLDCKIAALEAYSKEIRDWPHPRSRKGIEHLAGWRGASVGVNAAEAFMLGRQIE